MPKVTLDLFAEPYLIIVNEFSAHDNAVIEGEHDSFDGVNGGGVGLRCKRLDQRVQRVNGNVGQLQVGLVRNDVLQSKRENSDFDGFATGPVGTVH